MQALTGKTIVVVGGTGNIGPFVVTALLEREATVVVPSRSEAKLAELREHLRQHVGDADLGRLKTLVADIGDEAEAAGLRQRINDAAGTPSGVLAAVGNFVTARSLLEATAEELQQALDSALIAHFMVARTFLPTLKHSDGTYLMVQGPLAFKLLPELGTDLISIATAGQHMLFRALAQELDSTQARVVELVCHTFIRERQTQPQSPLSGEAVGAYAAHLLSGAGEEVNGQSIDLHSPGQLAAVGLDTKRL